LPRLTRCALPLAQHDCRYATALQHEGLPRKTGPGGGAVAGALLPLRWALHCRGVRAHLFSSLGFILAPATLRL